MEKTRRKGTQGITLVALVITIIVMIILVGVTITIALNGGIIDKAKTATTETKTASIQEAIYLAVAECVAEHNTPPYPVSPASADVLQNKIRGYLQADEQNKVTVANASEPNTGYTVTYMDHSNHAHTWNITPDYEITDTTATS